MASPRPKPSDDYYFWYGIPISRTTAQFLFDVLALVMSDLQRNDCKGLPMSFHQFRESLYRHMDDLAKEANSKARFVKIDQQILKARMDSFLGLGGR